ncbi:MAG: outer membrane lipoprotein carrier protein LolA [Verrucomicrobiales bacterium]|nr:outer membrane lipoprotein carrier protein LolA [Verrucomicrobiales bacterium]
MQLRSILLTITLFIFTSAGAVSAFSNDLGVVERWLQTNAETQSLKVDFVQSRSLKALKNPLVQPGTLWLDYATNQFRWQLGDPAKTIVVSQGEKIAVMRTPLKRIEYRDPDESSGSSSGFSSLTKGFPKTLPEFQKRYRILDIATKGNSFEIVTQPLGPESEGVHRFGFVIDQQRFLLKGLVIELVDGSNITTTFQRVDRNAKIEPAVFHPDTSGYRETKFKAG